MTASPGATNMMATPTATLVLAHIVGALSTKVAVAKEIFENAFMARSPVGDVLANSIAHGIQFSMHLAEIDGL